jgi:hypothetical protein
MSRPSDGEDDAPTDPGPSWRTAVRAEAAEHRRRVFHPLRVTAVVGLACGTGYAFHRSAPAPLLAWWLASWSARWAWTWWWAWRDPARLIGYGCAPAALDTAVWLVMAWYALGEV